MFNMLYRLFNLPLLFIFFYSKKPVMVLVTKSWCGACKGTCHLPIFSKTVVEKNDNIIGPKRIMDLNSV